MPTRRPQDLLALHTEARGHWVPSWWASVHDKTGIQVKATVLRGTEDDGCTAADLLAIDPSAELIERWYYDGNNWNAPIPDFRTPDLYQAGRNFLDAYIAHWHPDTRATIQTHNEPVNYGPGYPSWMIGQIDRGVELGVRVISGSFSTGTPDDNFWQLPQTADMIRTIIKHNLFLGLHEYASPDPLGSWIADRMARHNYILSLWPADCRGVRIWLNEYGVGAASIMSTDSFMESVKAGYAYLAGGAANVFAASLWSAGDWWALPKQQGPNSNIVAHSDKLRQWMIGS